MAESSNTLDLGSLRRPEPPRPPEESTAAETPAQPATQPSLVRPRLVDMARQRLSAQSAAPAAAQTAPVIHPEAAAIARQRIAKLDSAHPLGAPDAVPAAPTASLVTSKERLAARDDLGPAVSRRRMPSAVAPLITAVSIFLLVLLLFKAPILISQISYATSKPAVSTPANPAGAVIPADNTITISKINVHAPVEYIQSVQEADVQTALQSGVVHYGTTALPGQNGNVAIFGHSSNDWWEPGNYKFVFVLLDKLVPGDQITIDYNSVRYTYEVTGSRVVEPTAVDVLNPTPTPTLTLITCTPPGTSLKRLVVTAKQISPSPGGAAQSTAPAAGGSGGQTTLTSSAPSIFDQIAGAWKGVTNGFKAVFGGSPSASPSPTPSANPSGGASQLPAAN